MPHLLRTYDPRHPERHYVLGSTRVLELLPRAAVHDLRDVHFQADLDRLVCIVRAYGVVVDPLVLHVTTRKIRKAAKEVDGRV